MPRLLSLGCCSLVLIGLMLPLLAPAVAHAQDSAFMAPIGKELPITCASGKSISTNFTLVNLATVTNTVAIDYYKLDGSALRPSEYITLTDQGAQVIRRQYEATQFDFNEGSAVARGSVALGSVVQMRTLGQVPTWGAYVGVAAGVETVNIPLVARNGTGASGTANSQIVVQNTAITPTTFTISLVDGNGNTVRTTPAQNLNGNGSLVYTLCADAALADGYYSAVVTAAAGGRVTAVSNLFLGAHGLQTYSGFAAGGQKWIVPLFTARLPNNLSTPLTVQNISGAAIPAGGIKVDCVPDASSTVPTSLTLANRTAVGHRASYFFNPVTDWGIPAGFVGACTIDTTGFDTVAFVQMRVVGADNTAAYEAIPAGGTATTVIVPLYMKRLGCGIATAVTIQNLGDQAATVDIAYKQGDGAANNCSAELRGLTIPAGGSLIQNHRLADGTNAVPQVPDQCFGTMVVKSTNEQPLAAMVQITHIIVVPGDELMAHNVVTGGD